MSGAIVRGSREEIGSLKIARTLIRAEAAALAALAEQLNQRLLEAARIIIESAGKVIPAGVGTSGETARRMAHLLSVTGTPALFMHPTDGLHGGLGAIVTGDVVIAISKGGQSSEIIEFARRARQRGAGVIVLTCEADSVLSEQGDVVVILDCPAAAEPGGLISMGSTLVFAAWGDALAIVLMEARGYSWDEVLFTHPGGAVGRNAWVEHAVPEEAKPEAATPEPRSRPDRDDPRWH